MTFAPLSVHNSDFHIFHEIFWNIVMLWRPFWHSCWCRLKWSIIQFFSLFTWGLMFLHVLHNVTWCTLSTKRTFLLYLNTSCGPAWYCMSSSKHWNRICHYGEFPKMHIVLGQVQAFSSFRELKVLVKLLQMTKITFWSTVWASLV